MLLLVVGCALCRHRSFVLAEYTDRAVRHVLLRQGMLGVKVEIMLQHDPTGRNGPKAVVADHVTVFDPKE